MLMLWMGTFFAEGMLYLVPFAWRRRRVITLFIIALMLVSTLGLLSHIGISAWLLLGLLCIYRIGNLSRILKNRMHEQYLRRAFGRTSLWIFLIHAICLLMIVLPLVFVTNGFWYVLAVCQLLIAVALLAATCKNIAKLRFQMPQIFLTDSELPTVTLAIPARNETVDLESCLKSALANDYPKLEILVLDDCSQGRTADIIRDFAHNGVRFIKGVEPAQRWLAKNQAYQKLFEQATGDLILFCGVDARFGPQAIRSMVNLMAARQKSMLSVLPVRAYSSAASVFIQPMRYWWEMALPRRLFNKPAVLSTCWMIGREDLKGLGGFAAVSHTILPERYFAREMVKLDQYSFVRSSAELRVETVKNFHDQYATALRTRYPQVRRKPEWNLFLTLFHVLFLLLPLALLLVSPWWHPVTLWLPFLSYLLLVATHTLIVNVTDPANSLLAAITFPLAVLGDMYMIYSSMVHYEFGVVEWKDRNICIPVMHVVPRLPSLN